MDIVSEGYMKLAQAMYTGAVCGLKTVKEAIFNIELHSTQMFRYEDIDRELLELYNDYGVWQRTATDDMIPQAIVDKAYRDLDTMLATEPSTTITNKTEDVSCF